MGTDRLSSLAVALSMQRRHLPFVFSVVVAGCGSGDRVTSAPGVVEVEVLPIDDLCEIRSHQLSCSNAVAYLRDELRVARSAPLVIVWRGGVPPDQPRMTALLRRLKGAGFETVGLVSIATYTSASSPGGG